MSTPKDAVAAAANAANTKRIIEAFFAAVGKGDKAAALDLVAERVDWGGAGDDSIPWIGERQSRAEAGEFLDLLAENLSTEAFDITETIVEGNNAAVIVNLKQTVAKTGRVFEGAMMFHLKVEDSQIVRYRYYEDSLALARAYGSV